MLYGLILIVLVFFMPGGIVAGVRLLKAKVVAVVPRLPDERAPFPIAAAHPTTPHGFAKVGADNRSGGARVRWGDVHGAWISRIRDHHPPSNCKGEQVDDTIMGLRATLPITAVLAVLAASCGSDSKSASTTAAAATEAPTTAAAAATTEAPSSSAAAEQRAGRAGVPGADHQLPGRRHPAAGRRRADQDRLHRPPDRPAGRLRRRSARA